MRPIDPGKLFGKLALLSTALILGACSTANLKPSLPEGSSSSDQVSLTGTPTAPVKYDVATTLNITGTDTQSSILTGYGGGKILSWQPASGTAVLGQTTLQASKATGTKVASKRSNQKTHRIVEKAGSAAWGSGFGTWSGGVGTWSGGFGTWSGGVGAWSGGSSTSVSTSNPNVNIFNQIKLAQAEAYAPNAGSGIIVAVIDTGIDLAHPAFSGHLVAASSMYDWVDGDATPQEGFVSGATNAAFGHGTVVAGIIGQIAPNAKIMPLRVLDAEGYGDTTNVVSAIEWAAANGARVINLSLGSLIEDVAVNSAIKAAYVKNGMITVASSGNTNDTNITFPAANGLDLKNLGTGLIGVGSVGTTNLDVKSSFSTYGSVLEMVAPGESVYSTYPNNQTAYASGTSFAAPMVTAAAALALGQGTAVKLDGGQLAAALSNTSNSVSTVNPSYQGLLGKGRLNLEMFMKFALGL